MNDAEQIVAVDRAGSVQVVALLGPASAEEADRFGWPVRSAVARVQAWPGSAGVEAAVRGACEAWGGRTGTLALLSGPRWPQACRAAAALGFDRVVFARGGFFISPRGITPASGVKDYAKTLDAPRPPDLGFLRQAFVGMMELAADDVQADRLEQDDSLLDRYAVVRPAGHAGTVLVPVETVSDADWLASSWRAQIGERFGTAAADRPVEVVSLHLRCAVEGPDAFPAALPAGDGHPDARALLPASSDPPGRCLARERLLAGDQGVGPVHLLEPAGPIEIPEGWAWRVNAGGHVRSRRR